MIFLYRKSHHFSISENELLIQENELLTMETEIPIAENELLISENELLIVMWVLSTQYTPLGMCKAPAAVRTRQFRQSHGGLNVGHIAVIVVHQRPSCKFK